MRLPRPGRQLDPRPMETIGDVKFGDATLAKDCSSKLALRTGDQLEGAGKTEQ
jgi:hypothetical protein